MPAQLAVSQGAGRDSSRRCRHHRHHAAPRHPIDGGGVLCGSARLGTHAGAARGQPGHTPVEQSQRRVPVQYAKRVVGRREYGGQSTYIPIKVNMAGVVPVIFASSLLYLPALIAQFNQPDENGQVQDWVTWVSNYLTQGDNPLYMSLYFLLIFGFTYFYVAITFNPEEVSDNMKNYGGFIPGIRAGRPTTEFLEYVLSRITFAGAIYLGAIAMIPLIAFTLVGANQNFPFGGTSILIIVGVGLETVKQINAQMQQRNYEGLLK